MMYYDVIMSSDSSQSCDPSALIHKHEENRKTQSLATVRQERHY